MSAIVPPSSSPILLGIRFDPVTMESVVDRITGMLEAGRPHQVVTMDALAILRARSDAAYRAVAAGADLVIPDGTGVVWAARLLGVPIWQRVAGVELVDRLCAVAAARGYRVYFLGAAPGVADEAARALVRRHPGLTVAGTRHGYFALAEEAVVADAVRAARPHLLFVAMGVPRQELWIARHRDALGAAVSFGCGGSLDVHSGRLQRAPAWMQRLGLEWLFRLIQEPRRWRRVLALPRFVLLVLWERLRSRRDAIIGRGA